MSKTSMRTRLLTVLLLAASFLVRWSVAAATDPASTSASSAPASPSPNEAVADYATHIPITGPLSAFRESVASR